MITEELVDRLVEATREAKETIRQSHEALKDLRLLLKECDERLASIAAEVRTGATELVRMETDRVFSQAGIDTLKAGLEKALKQWLDELDRAKEAVETLNRKTRAAL